MCTRILKKESSLKVLPLVVMLISLMSMAQNCKAMEPAKFSGSDPSVKKETLKDTHDFDDIHWPDAAGELLKLIPVKKEKSAQDDNKKSPDENWNTVRKTLKFFHDQDFYNQIKTRELKNSRSIEDYQKKLVTEAWAAKEDVLTYLVNLYQQSEALISKVQEYERLAPHLKEALGDLLIQNQELMEKNAILSCENKELVAQNERSKQDISRFMEMSNLPACDLEETPIVLGSGSQGFLKEESLVINEQLDPNRDKRMGPPNLMGQKREETKKLLTHNPASYGHGRVYNTQPAEEESCGCVII